MRTAILTAGLCAALAAPALAQDFTNAGDRDADDVLIEEWTIPYENSRPRDPFTADGERIWFVGQRDDYLGWLYPRTGEIGRLDLPEGTGPHNQIVDADGNVWIAGNRDAYIGRYTPASNQFMRIDMPNGVPRDPHTLIMDAGGQYLWFTAQGANRIGRLNVATNELDVIDVPTENARPYGIEIDGNGTVWVVLLGTNKLAAIHPDTLQLAEITLPRAEARPRRIGVTDNGYVWYVDYAGGYIGAFDPETNGVQEWRAPSAENSRPYGMAVDAQNRIWFVETGVEPNNFVGFDPATESFFSQTPVPSGGGTLRHMQFFAPTGEIWFGADTNTIGRAVVMPAE
ncbi:virginiamycin B lyase family protein [Hyphobacterium sp.]|uniref:Vgb family protein n=1 Tax=Hyphobacterium sp. TaxID=2004662 RepID=UPI003BA9B9AC